MDQNTLPTSPIVWPSHLRADTAMLYESIDLLYNESPSGSSAKQLGFILSCSRPNLYKDNLYRGMLHKLEVETSSNFASARMGITHEVLPGLDSSSQIIPVNKYLKVACFDKGCIIPITNFGYKKTFNSDVRGRLMHHAGQISCLAANMQGKTVASGCTKGEITLYQVCRENIRFLTRTNSTCSPLVTAMSFMKSDSSASCDEEYLLVYTNDIGQICLLDTRCNLAASPKVDILLDTKPRVSLTSLVSPRTKSGQLIYLGGAHGELVVCDLRKCDSYVDSIQNNPEKGMIRRMKEIVIEDGDQKKTFIAYSNSTNKINIIDLDTMGPDDRWQCDRLPEGIVRDLIQVGDKIITCGDNVSIGCWFWNRS